MVCDRLVDGGIAAFLIRSDLNHIFGIGIDCHQFTHILCCFFTAFSCDTVCQTGNTAEYVDGRVVPALCKFPVKYNVPVQNTAYRIGNRLVHVIAVNEYGIKPGNRTF